MEIQYRLTPEQEQLQSHVLKRVQGMRWLFRVFMIFFVLVFLGVLAGAAFVITEIVTHLPR
jgi:hypothetical protein